MSVLEILKEHLRKDEGLGLKPYHDTRGRLTIGYGTNIEDGISLNQAEALMECDAKTAIDDARKLFHSFDVLDDTRKAVLSNMAYNLGYHGLSLFMEMRKAVEAGHFYDAAREMRDSEWYKEVGLRAERLALMMERGQIL